MKDKIDLLFRYLDGRSDAQSLFHKEIDFGFPALSALRDVIDAMNLLQPVSMREYKNEFAESYPEYGGDVDKQYSIVSRHFADVPRRGFDECTWEKLGLDKPGAMRRQYKEVWAAVFDFVEQTCRQRGMETAILSRIRELRPRETVASVKNENQSRAQRSRLPSSILKQIRDIQLTATTHETVADAEQEAVPPNAALTEVEEAHALAEPDRTTAAMPMPTLFSEMEKAFSEFEFVDKPARPSMFPEEITWIEKQERRTRRDAGKDVLSPEDNGDLAEALTASGLNEATAATASKIVFADAKVYKNWRLIFPLHLEGDDGGRLRWDDFCSLLTSPPLKFHISADGGPTLGLTVANATTGLKASSRPTRATARIRRWRSTCGTTSARTSARSLGGRRRISGWSSDARGCLFWALG